MTLLHGIPTLKESQSSGSEFTHLISGEKVIDPLLRLWSAGTPMQAQMLLDRKAARVPNTTAQAMQKAFDEAWQKVSPLSGGNQRAIEADRLTLAECVVTVTGDGTTDVEAIKRLALDMMQIVNRRW